MNIKLVSFLMISVLFNLSVSKCSEGCLKCEGNNICQVCDALNLYVLINGECLKQNLQFCMFSLNLNFCAKCYPGYYLELSGRCVSNPSHINEIPFCKEYYSYTRCQTCEQYYYITNEGQSCSRISGEPIPFCEVYDSDNKCKVCGDFILSVDQLRCESPIHKDNKCMFYSDSTTCSECKDTHYLDKNFYIHHIEDFYAQIISKSVEYYFSQNSVINVPVCESKTAIDKCVKSLDNHKCAECQEGYFINEHFNECIKNPEPSFFFRSDDIVDCFVHNKTIIERNNEPVLNIECVLCYEGYYKTVNNRKCKKHSSLVNNCQTMSQSINEECLICDSDYYRENDDITNEKCKRRVDVNANCLKYNLLSVECQECVDSSYVKHYNDIYCSPKIENCKIHDVQGKILSCQQCNFGYYFSIQDAQCLKSDTFDPYCAFYNVNKECKECSFGFYYDETATPAKCYPNSNEYVLKAKCNDFDPLIKNKCVGCASSSKIIKILNTCKLFPNDLYDMYLQRNSMKYCDKYEMTQTMQFGCKQPLPEIMNDDESQKKVYVLYTDQEKAYDKTSSKIQYCEEHQTIYKTGNEPLVCNKCYKTRFITTYFEYANVADLANCKEDETDSGFCAKYFSNYNVCREYNYSNINTHYCPYGYKGCHTSFGVNVCDHENTCQYCRWKCNYDSSYTVNNCAGGNWNNYECYSKDDNGNCMVFYFFRSNMSVNFTEDIEYEIVLSPDQSQCLMYDPKYIENNSDCVKVSDGDAKSCILCKKGYYSVPTKTFTYALDSVESYVSKVNVTDFVDKCIKFNFISKLCLRCAPGYFLSRNTCITCQGLNTAIDQSGLSCIQYVDENFGDKCKRTALIETTTHCVECKEGYVSQIIWDKAVAPRISFFPTLEGSLTMIELEAETSAVKKCIDTNDLFFIEENFQETLTNCLFYKTVDSITYCLGCKFGYSGTIVKTLNGFLTVQNCIEDSDCDLGQTYPLMRPYVSSLVTCHKCTDSSKVPTYHFFYTTAVDVDEPNFIYYPNHSSKKTMTCESPVVANCLIQFKTNDELVKQKWGGSDTICVYCQPKFSPTTTDVLDDFFPYQHISSCSPIPDCDKSLVPEICESCNSSPSNEDDNNMNLVSDGGVNSCVTNSYIDEDPYCRQTDSTSSSGICNECKDGYVYLNFKCIPLNITNCKYFRGSTCVESSKELDENKSILWREFNSDYKVEQINCVEITTGIPNCAYYTSEDVCYQCEDDYFLGKNGTECYQQTTFNCIEYDPETTLCKKCESGFDISSTGNCSLSTATGARGCEEYRNGICSKCTDEGFHPVKINTNKTSICINSTFAHFCEEIDEEMLLNDKVLSCKTCRKIKDYETVSTEDNFSISNFDFFSRYTSSYADENDLSLASDIWGHYSSMNSQFADNYAASQDLRIALFKYNFEVCQEFSPIENCYKYDDQTFENTFDCIECTANFYLENNQCLPRTLEDFCLEYYISKNQCKEFVDTWTYSIKYSSFDEFVIQNPPPTKESLVIKDSGIEGCIGYTNNNTCRFCNNTTYLYDNLCLTVVNIIPGCKIYSRDGLCTECQSDLILFQNKCLTIYSENCSKYLTNTSCQSCPKEYPYIVSGSCKKNPDISNCDEYMNTNMCFKCDQDYFRNQSGECVLASNYIENCKRHLDGPFCQECHDGYVLHENKCVRSPLYDQNCKKYTSTSICNVCAFNHYFKKGVCFECDTDPFSCYFCDPNAPSKCILCKPGFFMNELKECLVIPDFTQAMVKLYQESESSKYVSIIKHCLAVSLLVYGFVFI